MSIKKVNVLIYPSGGENAVNIYNSLKYNIHFELFGASICDNHSKYMYDKNHYFEGDLSINNPSFFDVLNKVIKKYDIKYILCTHDEVITFLSKNQNKIDAVLCSSPYETALVAGNKYLTYQIFKDKYYFPKVFSMDDKIKFPVFLKPFIGAGGKGTLKVNNLDELNEYYQDDLLICEYLPGNEYTVDCFTNKNGELIFARGRTRERISSGLPYRVNAVKDNSNFLEIAKDINNTLVFRGAWFFQLKEDSKGNLKLMEICVRQGGSMIFYRQLGFNFAAMTIFDFMGNDIVPIINDYDLEMDRCLHSSFKMDYEYENIYIDFDDTIVIDNKVNSDVMKFLYQSLNKKKNIYLLTKHINDIENSLKKYHIDINIFNKIYHLDDSQNKSSVIDKDKSIFIDNYFKERYDVHCNLNIPVFDVDAIESLIDDSEL